MKQSILGLGLAALLALPAASLAESVNTYQVTGPIVALTAEKIVVQKSDGKWEIARDPNTKIQGDLKVGAKVTVQYRMSATKIEGKNTSSTEKK
jgi:hypothetical protein